MMSKDEMIEQLFKLLHKTIFLHVNMYNLGYTIDEGTNRLDWEHNIEEIQEETAKLMIAQKQSIKPKLTGEYGQDLESWINN